MSVNKGKLMFNMIGSSDKNVGGFLSSFSVTFHFLYLYSQILDSVCSVTFVKSLSLFFLFALTLCC